MHCHTVHFRNYYIFGNKGFCSAAGQSKKIKLLWFSSINLASEYTSTRAHYMTAGSVTFYLSDDKSTQVKLSPGAKHLLVGCVHSAQKCIVACLITLRYLNCVIAGVIHLWNGNQQVLLSLVSLIDYFLRHRKMNKAPLTFWSISTVESSKLYTVASRSHFVFCTLKQMVPFLSK